MGDAKYIGHVGALALALGIGSAVELPELPPGPGPFDVAVGLGSLPDAPRNEATNGAALRVTPDHASLYFRETGAFRVQGGREITVDPEERQALDDAFRRDLERFESDRDSKIRKIREGGPV